MVTSLAPTVSTLISSLLPWLDSSESSHRSRSLERSDAVRRSNRSPSLSAFWRSRPQFYVFLQQNWSTFSPEPKGRPTFGPEVTKLADVPPAIYSIAWAGIKVWEGGKWTSVHVFDSIDLMISFPLPKAPLYFEMRS